MSEPPPTPRSEQRPEHPQNIATSIAEISERATQLIREEIELARAEVTEKAIKLARGAVVGVAAGVFFLTALMFVLIGCAWLLYYLIPGGDFTYFWGFFAMALILVVLGVIAGLLAARLVKRSTPPVPTLAIEEARRIRDTVSASAEGAEGDPLAPPPAAPPPIPEPAPVSGGEGAGGAPAGAEGED